MVPTTPRPPDERFAAILDGLCRAIAARGAGAWLALPLMLLLWSRLRRTARHLSRLAALVAAGQPPRAPAASRRPAARRSSPPRLYLPRGRAWLVRRLPEAAGYGSQLQALLAAPDMAALLEAAPQARRLLNPLCRMLGVRPPGRTASPQAAPATAAPDPAPAGNRGDAAAPPPRIPRPAPGPGPRAVRHGCGPPVPA